MDIITDIHKLRSILETLSSEEKGDSKIVSSYVAMFFKIHNKEVELFSKESDKDFVESFCDGFDNPDKMVPLLNECQRCIAFNEDSLKCAEILKDNYNGDGDLKEKLIELFPLLEKSLSISKERLDILEHQYRFYKDPKAVIAEQMEESKRQEEEYKRTHPDYKKGNSGCMVVLIIMIIFTLLLI